MRYEFGVSISAYVIEPGTAVSGGRLAVLRGAVPVWFYDAGTGGSRYTDLLDASLAPVDEVETLNSATELGYLPKFYGPDGVTRMWADANGGAGPRHLIEMNEEKLALAGAQTIIGDKTITGLILSTNTHSWQMPINATFANQVGAIQIRNDNTVDPTGSPDLFVIWYKGNTDADRAGWFNEWGGIRVRVPNLSKLGYADVGIKVFEATSGGEDGLQVWGPSALTLFAVRNGAITAVSMTLSGNATAATPTLPGHLVTKAYADALVAGGAPDATTSSKGIVQLAGDLAGTAALPTVPALSSKADDSAVVKLTGNQTVAGVKTFSSSPVVPSPAAATDAAPKRYTDAMVGLGALGDGFKAWNLDPKMCPGAGTLLSSPGAGTVRSAKIVIPAGTITNLHMQLGTAGASLTAGQCHIGLFDASKNLLSEATGPGGVDLATTWSGTTGLLTMPLVTPQVVTDGVFYIAFFYNGTTAPAFFAITSTKAGLANGLNSVANSNHASANTLQTISMPNPMGAFTATLVAYFVAVS